jgi:probable phosphoglycerate mutase
MTKILLVRHGHVEGIEPERFRGRHDVPLSELGLAQARAVARHIASRWRSGVVYTSPLQRCVQTGHEIAHLCGAVSEVLPAMNDIDYGEWQWQTHDEVRARHPVEFDLWRNAPQRKRFARGESLQDVEARVADGLRMILQRHPEQTVVVVGHDSSNRVLLLQLLGLPLSAYWSLAQDPCGLSEIEVSRYAAKIHRVNESRDVSAAEP